MRRARVYVSEKEAGVLTELIPGKEYLFEYAEGYSGVPVSRTMPPEQTAYRYNEFPPFFEGLLPEGIQLDGLLSNSRIDKNDYFSQLIAVGEDLVGAVTVKEIRE